MKENNNYHILSDMFMLDEIGFEKLIAASDKLCQSKDKRVNLTKVHSYHIAKKDKDNEWILRTNKSLCRSYIKLKIY